MAVLKPIAEQKERYRSMIDAILADATKRIESGEIAVQSVEDLEKLIKLDLLLIGAPTDRKETVSIMNFSKELRALLDAKIKELEEKSCTESE